LQTAPAKLTTRCRNSSLRGDVGHPDKTEEAPEFHDQLTWVKQLSRSGIRLT
jgi:hypothetical protein